MSDNEPTPSEIAEIGRLMEALTDSDRTLESPPDSVWAAIELELAADQHRIAAPATSTGTDVVVDLPTPRSAPESHRIRYLLAAVVFVVAALGVTAIFNRGADEVIVASADISNAGLPLESPAHGTATLVSVDGTFHLDLHVEQLETADGYFELWVARADASEVRSLGAINGDGRFEWPEGMTPDDFPAVAISLEHNDGDPTFSGMAVLFGVLDL